MPSWSGIDLLLLEETVDTLIVSGVLSGSLSSSGKWYRSRCRWFLEVDLSVVLRLQYSRWLLTEAIGSTVEVRNLWYIYEVLRRG